jgi:hypothetical protein
MNWLFNKLGYVRKSDVVSDTPQVEITSLSEEPKPIKPKPAPRRRRKKNMRSLMRSAMKSKTIWLGLALVILGAMYDNFSYVQNLIHPQWYGVIIVAIGVAVAVLRFVTTLPLDKK